MSRYDRQVILPEIGAEGQERLRRSTVAVVGLGGLGSVAVELLCRAGVGNLILVDHDVVELSNLPRQSLYEEKDVGTPKAAAAADHLKKINNEVKINNYVEQINMKTAKPIDGADLLLDCTDNLETRLLLNAYAVKRRMPSIFCSAQGTRAMLYVVDPRQGGRACFACIFDKLKAFAQPAQTGVLNTAVHLAATLQAAEALKILLGKPYTRGLISLNAWDLRLEVFSVNKRKGCEVCGEKVGKREEVGKK
jgi:molybdopterin/thiamine biosynthesis adenylyltransferase